MFIATVLLSEALMGFLLCFNEVSMRCSIVFPWSFLRFQCGFHVVSMGFPLGFHVISIKFPWEILKSPPGGPPIGGEHLGDEHRGWSHWPWWESSHLWWSLRGMFGCFSWFHMGKKRKNITTIFSVIIYSYDLDIFRCPSYDLGWTFSWLL
jgi:hypothetical protein